MAAYNRRVDSTPQEHASHQKRMAAMASIGSAIILLALKMFLVYSTGSLGVLSEALHSFLDLLAAVLTFYSVSIADKPADSRHLYGHGKIESFSAFVETALLLVTAIYIIYEAVTRLITGHLEMRPSLTAILILLGCMFVDFLRSRKLARVSEEFPSEALEADALHFSTDIWSTFVVILGIGGAWLGFHFGIPWLGRLDSVAALIVAGVIIWIGSRLGKRTVEALLDVAPSGMHERIEEAVSGTEGVLRSERVRVRRAGQRYFVDVTISVPRTSTLEQAHEASQNVENAIDRIVPADVVVHVEPRAKSDENLFETIRAIAQKRGLAVHELSAHQYEGRLFIELHLEVDEQSSLKLAHERATELEEDIRAETDHNALINIHIEPLGTKIAGAEDMKILASSVQDYLNSLQAEYHELADCHDVHVRSVDHKILVSCHCSMDGSLPITEVHDITAAVEDRVKERFPQIYRLTIHPEPVGEG
jgi:cation diffusion facilitator family transporter